MTTRPDGRSRYTVFSRSSASAEEAVKGNKAAKSPEKRIKILNFFFSKEVWLRLEEYFFEV